MIQAGLCEWKVIYLHSILTILWLKSLKYLRTFNLSLKIRRFSKKEEWGNESLDSSSKMIRQKCLNSRIQKC